VSEPDPDHAVFLRSTETTQWSMGYGVEVYMDEVCPDCFAKRGSDYPDEPQKTECSYCSKPMEMWESKYCSRKFRKLIHPACCESHMI